MVRETNIPDDMQEKASKYRENLIEVLADVDENLMIKYLEGEQLSEQEIKEAVRKACISVKAIPVLCGSSYKNKGVQLLLDAIVEYLPSPLDVPPISGINPETGEEVQRKNDDEEPFSALAFKIVSDPYVGKLTYFRVYSGTVKTGSYIYNSTKGKRERIGRILYMHANHRQEVDEAMTGDIAAVGLKKLALRYFIQ